MTSFAESQATTNIRCHRDKRHRQSCDSDAINAATVEAQLCGILRSRRKQLVVKKMRSREVRHWDSDDYFETGSRMISCVSSKSIESTYCFAMRHFSFTRADVSSV